MENKLKKKLHIVEYLKNYETNEKKLWQIFFKFYFENANQN